MKTILISLSLIIAVFFLFNQTPKHTGYLDEYSSARSARDNYIANVKERHSKKIAEDHFLDGFKSKVVYSKIFEKDEHTYTMISYSPSIFGDTIVRKEDFNKMELNIRKRVSETRFQNTSNVQSFL